MIWVVMLLAGLITFLIRLSFIWFFGRLQMPGWFMRALNYVPIAVFAAIIFPTTLAPEGFLNLTLSNPRIPAAALAALVAWKTRNVIYVVVAGMAALWILSALSG